jgi:hypothetical protein
MKIQLSDNPDPSPFAFKLGDKVKSMIGTMGVVIAGDCYPDLGNYIFYLVKLPNGMVFTYMQGDIQLFQEQRPPRPQPKIAHATTC